METTPSGLIIPVHAIVKTREVWPREDAKVIQRAGKILLQRGVQWGLICPTCNAAKKKDGGLLVPSVDPHTNELLLSCSCTVRIQEKTFAGGKR